MSLEYKSFKISDFTVLEMESESSLLPVLFKDFKLIGKSYYGFWGLFGPNETIRRILGVVDIVFERVVPESSKYIGVYVFQKVRGKHETEQ